LTLSGLLAPPPLHTLFANRFQLIRDCPAWARGRGVCCLHRRRHL